MTLTSQLIVYICGFKLYSVQTYQRVCFGFLSEGEPNLG